jgi:hypothetical protein
MDTREVTIRNNPAFFSVFKALITHDSRDETDDSRLSKVELVQSHGSEFFEFIFYC